MSSVKMWNMREETKVIHAAHGEGICSPWGQHRVSLMVRCRSQVRLGPGQRRKSTWSTSLPPLHSEKASVGVGKLGGGRQTSP